MVTVGTIGRIRRAFLVERKPIRQPPPRLGAYVARLDAMLETNSKRPRRERLTARRLFELLRAEG